MEENHCSHIITGACELGFSGSIRHLKTPDKILDIGKPLVLASFVLKIYFMCTERQLSA